MITQEIANKIYKKLGGSGNFSLEKAKTDPIARAVPIPYELLDSWEPTNVCVEIIKQFEGFAHKAMKDLSNNGTYVVGYGIVTSNPNETISLEEGERRLRNALPIYTKPVIDISKKKKWYISTNMFDALVDYCYNAGKGKLNSICKKANNINDIYRIFIHKAEKTPKRLRGVKRRRLVDAKLCMNILENSDLNRSKNSPMPHAPYDLSLNIEKLQPNPNG